MSDFVSVGLNLDDRIFWKDIKMMYEAQPPANSNAANMQPVAREELKQVSHYQYSILTLLKSFVINRNVIPSLHPSFIVSID